MSTAKVDLHKLARITNLMVPASVGAFFFAGYFLSFWFHFGTVAFLMATVANVFYRHVQTQHTILRNFGIVGQMRYVLESVGPELRQYLFSSDMEERPFNRVERSEVYRKAKGIEGAQSFGTQYDYDEDEIKLRHSLYPTPKAELEPYRLAFGEERGEVAPYVIDKPILVSAMSYGSLGERAIRCIARGARLAGIAMNTGEGGYPKHHLREGCDVIFQMGTAKFGVRNDDGSLDDDKLAALAGHEQVKMVEIKFSQGAKPGKGGLLPKEKITPEISELRGVPMEKDVISPPYHLECRDAPSTVRFIRRVQEVAGVPVGIKLCVGDPREVVHLIEEMKEQGAFPDYISIDGGEGGTGAAPKAFLDGVGMPLLPALRAVNQLLTELGVRDRLKLLAAGKLITPARQVGAMCLGADAVYTARGFMLAIGCIQALQCSQNTCPVGITTHDPRLQRGLVISDKAQRVANYVSGTVHDIEELLCSMGVKRVRDLTFEHLFVPHDAILSHLEIK